MVALVGLAAVGTHRSFPPPAARDAPTHAAMRRGEPDRLLVTVADAHHDRGQHALAVATYERALTVTGPSAYALTNQGVSLHALGRSEEALRAFEQALHVDPTYWKAHFNTLVIRANRREYDDALDALGRLRVLARHRPEVPPLDALEQHLRSRARTAGSR